MVKKLAAFLQEEVSYQSNIPRLQRKILLNALLIVVISVIALFTIYDYFLTQNYIFFIIEGFTLLSFTFAFLSLRYFDNYDSAVTISAITLFLFTFFFISVNDNQDFGLIWSVFFPIFVIFTMGHKTAIPLVAIYYTVVLFLSYKGIGVWQNGQWNDLSFLRYGVAMSILIYVAYVIELSQESISIKIKRLMQKEQQHIAELEKLSVTDGMTSLYNKRFFNRILKREFYRARRHSFYFGFFILDVDFFKQYNDTYGHQKGDEVLIAIADLMQSHLQRHEDFVFRLGGEEFGAIMTADSEEKIIAHTQKLCRYIEALQLQHSKNKSSKYVTASVGLIVTNTFNDTELKQLYKKADDALYKAKEGGRNKVVVA